MNEERKPPTTQDRINEASPYASDLYDDADVTPVPEPPRDREERAEAETGSDQQHSGRPDWADRVGIPQDFAMPLTTEDRPFFESFAELGRDLGLDSHQVEHIFRWYADTYATPPQEQPRGRGMTAAEREGIDVARLTTDEIRQVMRTNFSEYRRLGLDKEYSRRLQRGGR